MLGPSGRSHLDPTELCPDGDSLAASLFALLGVLQYRVLPKRPVSNQSHAAPSCASKDFAPAAPLHDGSPCWRAATSDPVPGSTSPRRPYPEAADATRLLGGVFTLSAVIGVLLQLPVSCLQECRSVRSPSWLGIGPMGLGYPGHRPLAPGRRRAC